MPPRQATPQPIAANSLEASPNHPLVRKLLFPQLDPAKPIPPIFDGARFGELNDEYVLSLQKPTMYDQKLRLVVL
jgi:hypothetical protein